MTQHGSGSQTHQQPCANSLGGPEQLGEESISISRFALLVVSQQSLAIKPTAKGLTAPRCMVVRRVIAAIIRLTCLRLRVSPGRSG
jgi:hypothetical protein